MSFGFEIGKSYNRRADVHARFGGQQQGGIIIPAEHPVVIIITGEEGLAHGYEDRYRDDGAFLYFGEGQIGDMRMQRGNAAIAHLSRLRPIKGEGREMNASYMLGLLSGITGFVAAFYWYLASKVKVTRVWEFDPELKPKNMTHDAWQIAHALEAAFFHSSAKNKTASIWTAISVGLGALSMILSRLS